MCVCEHLCLIVWRVFSSASISSESRCHVWFDHHNKAATGPFSPVNPGPAQLAPAALMPFKPHCCAVIAVDVLNKKSLDHSSNFLIGIYSAGLEMVGNTQGWRKFGVDPEAKIYKCCVKFLVCDLEFVCIVIWIHLNTPLRQYVLSYIFKLSKCRTFSVVSEKVCSSVHKTHSSLTRHSHVLALHASSSSSSS